jgi:glycosyltransferase 2 family protein
MGVKVIIENIKSFYIKHKKKISISARILISAGLISYLVFFRSGFEDFNTFLNILKTVDLALLAASASTYLFGIWISALRWQILLKTQNIKISQGFLVSSLMIGLFFNNLLPTSIGGDIFRTLDISKKAGVSAGRSASIIIIERLSGIVMAATFATVALFFGFATVGQTSYIIPVVIFFFLCIIALFIILNPSVLKLDRVVKKVGFLLKIREKLKEIYHTFQSFKKYKAHLAGVLICSFLLQLGVIYHYYLASISMGIELSFVSFIFIVPVITIISMLPISIGGAGVRENSLVFLMAALGASAERSATVSLILLAMLLILGLIGAIIYIVRPFVMKQAVLKNPDSRLPES